MQCRVSACRVWRGILYTSATAKTFSSPSEQYPMPLQNCMLFDWGENVSFQFLFNVFCFCSIETMASFECSYSAWTEGGSGTTVISSNGWDTSDKAECCMPDRFSIPTAVIIEDFFKFTVSYAFIIPAIPLQWGNHPYIVKGKKRHTGSNKVNQIIIIPLDRSLSSFSFHISSRLLQGANGKSVPKATTHPNPSSCERRHNEGL